MANPHFTRPSLANVRASCSVRKKKCRSCDHGDINKHGGIAGRNKDIDFADGFVGKQDTHGYLGIAILMGKMAICTVGFVVPCFRQTQMIPYVDLCVYDVCLNMFNMIPCADNADFDHDRSSKSGPETICVWCINNTKHMQIQLYQLDSHRNIERAKGL